MSVSSNSANSVGLGRARANHGSSHRPYWGEYTLLVSRNKARMGNPRVHRGKPGATRRRTSHTAPTEATRSSAENRFRAFGLHEHPGWWWSRVHTTNHRLSQSAPRLPLNLKKVAHDPNPPTTNGRLTAA